MGTVCGSRRNLLLLAVMLAAVAAALLPKGQAAQAQAATVGQLHTASAARSSAPTVSGSALDFLWNPQSFGGWFFSNLFGGLLDYGEEWGLTSFFNAVGNGDNNGGMSQMEIQGILNNINNQLTTINTDLQTQSCSSAYTAFSDDVKSAYQSVTAPADLLPYLKNVADNPSDTSSYNDLVNDVAAYSTEDVIVKTGAMLTGYGYNGSQPTTVDGMLQDFGYQLTQCNPYWNANDSVAYSNVWMWAATDLADACMEEENYYAGQKNSSDQPAPAVTLYATAQEECAYYGYLLNGQNELGGTTLTPLNGQTAPYFATVSGEAVPDEVVDLKTGIAWMMPGSHASPAAATAATCTNVVGQDSNYDTSNGFAVYSVCTAPCWSPCTQPAQIPPVTGWESFPPYGDIETFLSDSGPSCSQAPTSTCLAAAGFGAGGQDFLNGNGIFFWATSGGLSNSNSPDNGGGWPQFIPLPSDSADPCWASSTVVGFSGELAWQCGAVSSGVQGYGSGTGFSYVNCVCNAWNLQEYVGNGTTGTTPACFFWNSPSGSGGAPGSCRPGAAAPNSGSTPYAVAAQAGNNDTEVDNGQGVDFPPIGVGPYVAGTSVTFTCKDQNGNTSDCTVVGGASCQAANQYTLSADTVGGDGTGVGFAWLGLNSPAGCTTGADTTGIAPCDGHQCAWTVTATAAGYAPQTFTLTAIPAPNTPTKDPSSDNQSVFLGTVPGGEETFPQPLAAYGYPASATVTFICTPPSGGGCTPNSSAPATATADAGGNATLNGLAAGETAGTYVVQATSPLASSLAFQEFVIAACDSPCIGLGNDQSLVVGSNGGAVGFRGDEAFGPLVATGYPPNTAVTFTCSDPSGHVKANDCDFPVQGSGSQCGFYDTAQVMADANGTVTLAVDCGAADVGMIASGVAGTWTATASSSGSQTLNFEETVTPVGATPTPTPTPQSVVRPKTATIVSGNSQQEPVGGSFAPLAAGGYDPNTLATFTCTLPSGGTCLIAGQPGSRAVMAGSDGVATLDGLQPQDVGTYSVSVAADGYTTLTFVETVLGSGESAAPKPASIVSGNNQQQSATSGVAGGGFAPLVAGGYGPGTAVTFLCSAPSGGTCRLGNGSDTQAVTAASDGTATLSGLSAQGAGTYGVSVTAEGYTTLSFAETVLTPGQGAAPPKPAAIVSGDDQQQSAAGGVAGGGFAPLVANGYAAGTAVTFTCTPPGNGTCLVGGKSGPQTVTAASDGTATLDGFSAQGAEAYSVTATADGYTTLTFAETVLAPDQSATPKPVTIVSGNDQRQTLGLGVAGGVFAPVVVGGYAPGTAVTFTCTPPSGGDCRIDGDSGPKTVTAGSDGVATLDGLSAQGEGAYTVTVTADGYQTVTFEETVLPVGGVMPPLTAPLQTPMPSATPTRSGLKEPLETLAPAAPSGVTPLETPAGSS